MHDAYFEVGVDCVETNTFGANLANLGEYDIADRIYELAEAGARIAREAADAWSTPDRPRLVHRLASGPGTKLPSLGHAPYADAARRLPEQVARHDRRRRRRRAVETAQDLLQAKAAVDRRPARADGRRARTCPSDRPGHGRDDRHDAARHARSAPR